MNENEKMVLNEVEEAACEHCGAVHPVSEMTETADGYVCKDCLSEYTPCEECGELILNDDIIETSDGHFYCDDCLNIAGYVYCDHCESYVPESDTYSVHGGWGWENWCIDCVDNDTFYCDNCNEYYDNTEYSAQDGPNGEILCPDCYDDNVVECGGCGELIWRSDAHWDDDADEYLCWDCYTSSNHRNVIHDYGFKPRPEFRVRGNVYHGEVPVDVKALFFGVEDEVDKGENPREAAADVQDVTDALYIKHDGSLSNGFEIVTHPCTLDYHMYEFPWRGVCSAATKHGFLSHDARTCGLHVHVGCSGFADTREAQQDVVAKIVLLVDRHWDALVKFSRRKESQLDHWASRPALDRTIADEWMLRRDALGVKDAGRYQAINLTNLNRNNTIEFRLFNGSLKRDTIIATLQLVNNICKYAMGHSYAEVLASTFMDIVNTEEFKELLAYTEERLSEGHTDPDARTVYSYELGDNVSLAVGDHVRCVNNDSYGIDRSAIGLTGTIVYVYDPATDYGGYDYIVIFDNLGGPGHSVTIPGEEPDRRRNGYFFHRGNLARII